MLSFARYSHEPLNLFDGGEAIAGGCQLSGGDTRHRSGHQVGLDAVDRLFPEERLGVRYGDVQQYRIGTFVEHW